MIEDAERRDFQFIGERLWLDFVNTQVVAGGAIVDLLGNFDDLIAWGVAAQILASEQAGALRQWSGTEAAERTFAQALELRAALRVMAEQIVRGQIVPHDTLIIINEVLRQRQGYVEVVRAGDGYTKRFCLRITEPVHLLVPIADSAADLLSANEIRQVRKCEARDCILYFYDTTKSHTRRWCSMRTCGNRAKAAAHYRRKRLQN